MKRGAWAKNAATTKPEERKVVERDFRKKLDEMDALYGYWTRDELVIQGRKIDWPVNFQGELARVIGGSILQLSAFQPPPETQQIFTLNGTHEVQGNMPPIKWTWSILKVENNRKTRMDCQGISSQEPKEPIHVTHVSSASYAP